MLMARRLALVGMRCAAWRGCCSTRTISNSVFALMPACSKPGAVRTTTDHFAVDMGPARTDWQDIPLTQECDTAHVPLSRGDLTDPVAVNMGNPHAVFFVDEVETVAIETLGPDLEHDPIFPEKANIGIAQVVGPDTLRLRVWERGVGLTLACGTGACAAAVAAHRRGLTGRNVKVIVDGGSLNIEWRENGHVVMSGPAEESFRGMVSEDAFSATEHLLG